MGVLLSCVGNVVSVCGQCVDLLLPCPQTLQTLRDESATNNISSEPSPPTDPVPWRRRDHPSPPTDAVPRRRGDHPPPPTDPVPWRRGDLLKRRSCALNIKVHYTLSNGRRQ